MEPLPFKIISDHFMLCVFLCLLWGVTDSNTTTTTTATTQLTTPSTIHSTTKPSPENVNNVTVLTQNESSITLQWDKVNDIPTYFLQYNNGIDFIDSVNESPVKHVVTSLSPGTKYNFILITFEGVNSTGYTFVAVTAPLNAKDFTSAGQTETSITLQWTQVVGFPNYILKFNEKEENAPASGGNSVTIISDLTDTTKYDFFLFTVFENVTSSGINTTACTAPRNVNNVTVLTQNESSITLTWDKVNAISTYFLQYGTEDPINAPVEESPVKYVVTSLSPGTKYNFTLITVFEGINSTGYTFVAVTAPRNVNNVTVLTQNESSITLTWDKVNAISTYFLQYGTEDPINAPVEESPVKHVVTSLSPGTKYNFTLITVFEGINSTGYIFDAVTAPLNAKDFTSAGQTETSITLQWTKVDGFPNYILKFNKKEENAPASGTIISNLTDTTKYDFTLFTVFENVRSRGINTTAFTAPRNVNNVTVLTQNESSITLTWDKVNNISTYFLQYGTEDPINAPVERSSAEHVVTSLSPGTKYNFTLITVFEGIHSTGYTFDAVTAPLNAKYFTSVGQNETSITLQWTKVDGFPNYILKFNEKEENAPASGGNSVTQIIPNLTNTTKYDFTLFTVFENVRSRGINTTAFTAPRNVNNVTVLTQNESSITLMWDKVNAISTYFLQYDTEDPINAPVERSSAEHVVTSLSPGTKYNFILITVFEGIHSTGYTFDAVTVPSKVALVNVTERSVNNITLMWTKVKNDWDYFIQIDEENSQLVPNTTTNVVSHSITSLKPGTEYQFSVITMFSDLNSTAYEGFTVTAINCTNVAWRVTNSSIQGLIKGLFSNATATNRSQTHVSPGGEKVSFTGLYPGATYEVSLVYERNSTLFLQCSHKLIIIPPDLSGHCEYWAAGYSVSVVWNKPAGVWTSVEVNVTGKSHIVSENGEQHLKISGFLPARTYEVSLASRSGNLRSSEPFVFLCLTDPRGVIAGSVFAVLLFCVLVCLAVFIFLKRPDIISRKKAFVGGSRQSNKCKDISVAKFPDHFYQLCVDENRGFSLEYESLVPVGTEQTKKAAILPENKPKNRFNNVQPYDWCRVKLTTSNPNETSDYINASYMPGYNSKREYIASQGPLPSTVNEFWRMIWEQKVKGIVMVTNCTEGGRTKCERYWPADSKPCPYGGLSVTIRSEQQEPNWTLREFRVKHTNNSEERTVKHFHFTAWPDHGVPQGTEVLIQFRKLVRQHIEREGDGAPTVVHCSAGVGRTGTIIALDVLLQQLEKERAVGIHGFVHKMRLSRPYMVQTESQYVFLHQCIMDRLQPNEETEEHIYENTDMIYANATALRQLRND